MLELMFYLCDAQMFFYQQDGAASMHIDCIKIFKAA